VFALAPSGRIVWMLVERETNEIVRMGHVHHSG